MYVLVWHYHDNDVERANVVVQFNLTGLSVQSGKANVRQYRTDADHSKAFAAGKNGFAARYAQLEKAGQLAEMDTARPIVVKNSTAAVSLTLPRQAVSLLVIEWFHVNISASTTLQEQG